MGGSSFDMIAQELLRQKQVMDQMEAENRGLRHQLVNLREGRGIFVEIDGRRFALVADSTAIAQAPAEGVAAIAITTVPLQESIEEEAEAAAEITDQFPRIPGTPQPAMDFLVNEKEDASPTFLEEVMIDEFAAAATSPLAVWSGTPTEPAKPQEPINETEKAALRQQLIGSFLLE